MMADRSALTLLGPVDVRAASGAPATAVLARSKHVAMLAVLAMDRNAPVPRRRLVSLLWPDLDDERARHAVSKAIHNCRRVLGEAALSGRSGDDIALSDGEWQCDLWELEDALEIGDISRAMSLYNRGPFLGGLVVADALELEQWIGSERERLRQRTLGAVLRQADVAERAQDQDRLSQLLATASLLDPLSERVLRRRLQVMDVGGDRSGAMQLYARFASRLQEELDITPAPETVSLADSIRGREAVVRTSSSEPQPAPQAFATIAGTMITSPDITQDRATVHQTVHQQDRASVHLPLATKSRPTGRRVPAVIATAVMVLAVTFGWRALGTSGLNDAHGSNGLERVIVTPFVNQSADSSLDAMGEMAATMFNRALAQTGVVEVIDERSRVRSGLSVTNVAARSTELLADIARNTGATRIVTGSYYIADSMLVVIATIRRATGDSAPLKFAMERGSRDDPGAVLRLVQERLMGLFAAAKDPRVAASATTSTSAPSYAAYQEYVRGLGPFAADDIRSAALHFERALALDSNFIGMMPMLTEVLVQTGRGARAESLMTRLSQRREVLPPYDRALVDFWLGFRDGRREAMYESTRKMIALAPGSADAQWMHGFAAIGTNRFREASNAFDIAREQRGWMQQKLFTFIRWPALALHLLGDGAGNVALARDARRRFPFDPQACIYEIQALALRAPLSELEGVLSTCVKTSGGIDAPMQASTRFLMASELRAHGRAADARQFVRPAIAFFQKKSSEEPADASWRASLARSLMAAGEWGEALALYEAVASATTEPSGPSPLLLSNMGVCAARVGNLALAQLTLAKIEGTAFAVPSCSFFARASLRTWVGRMTPSGH